MMSLHHAIKVAAPRSEVFEAISGMHAIAAWHLGTVEGAVAPGRVLHLVPRPGLRFAWRTDEIRPGQYLRQTCIVGPGTSPGKVVTFTLADLPEGGTHVALTDGDWAPEDPHLPFCNTRWGEVLLRLRQYVERDREPSSEGSRP